MGPNDEDDESGQSATETYSAGGADHASQSQTRTQGSQKPEWWKTHPGFAESLLPVWGPAREAVADAVDGNPWGAAANVALAGLDVLPGAELLDDGIKLGSHSWPATRQWLTKTNFADKGQVVHHFLFERNRGIGKHLPDWFKNQPFNLKAMPSAEIHDRLNYGAWGKPQLNPLERYWHGTPFWFKASNAGGASHGLLGGWRLYQDHMQSSK